MSKYERKFPNGAEGKYKKVLLLLPERSRVLELGGASGYFSLELVAAGHRVTTIDIDELSVEDARQRGLDAHVSDLNHSIPDSVVNVSEIEVVLMMDVLEHLIDPKDQLVDLFDRLPPQALLVVTGPNVAYWAVRLKLLFGKWNYATAGIMDRTHLRWFTQETWRELIEESGFKVQFIEVAESMLPLESWLLKCRVKEAAILKLRSFLAGVWPTLFATVFVVVARKECA